MLRSIARVIAERMDMKLRTVEKALRAEPGPTNLERRFVRQACEDLGIRWAMMGCFEEFEQLEEDAHEIVVSPPTRWFGPRR